MQKSSTAQARRSLLVSIFVLGLFAALFILPYQFRSEAVVTTKDKKGLVVRTESHQPDLENYDIREQKSEEVGESLMKFRNDLGKSASAIADTRDNFVRGEESLRTKVKSVKVEYSPNLGQPEVITPDVYKANIERLSAPTSGIKNAEILRNFAKQYNSLVGMEDSQINNLKVIADYTNPAKNMSFAHLEQRINGVPVFTGELKAGFTMNGEIVRVINNLAPGLDYDSLSADFRSPLDAVKVAAGHINYKLQKPDVTRNDAVSSDLKVVFGEGDWATTAEKMYFPTEVGVARPAWRVLIWQPVNAFYVIVDAETGTMLWRKNITEDQTESATYDVYANPLSAINAADSPAPLTPYTGAGPADGTQGALLNRTNVTLIGNEGPLSFNNNGWITDGNNSTDGNATEAGLDIDGANGVDAPVMGASRVFSSAWNPPPGSPAPGDAPSVPAARDGAVIQMFYIMNRYHDALYQLGWTEQAFNFQQDNFGRGGIANDRVSSEGQDSAGTNNANFSTPADGGRGRMQMFIFTGTIPNRDGTADGDIIIHEVTHGLSNRLHGNAAGLNSNMSRGMGEGWCDWYAFALLSSSNDPVDGVYAGGGHVLLNGFGAGGIGTENYYYGIRSLPKATLATTGGPGNLPHNPATFADLDSLQEDRTNGAFPPKTGVHISGTADQVHRAGEIWSIMLWEVRAQMINRLGHVDGNNKALQVVTDGMKLSPITPTFIQARDAIIAAAAALPFAPAASADVIDVREGFRIRGMGFSAEVTTAGPPARVVEAFDFPNVQHIDPFSVSDASGDGDGFPEPGENLTLSVPVTNTTGAAVTNVMVDVSGGTPVSFGSIADGATVTMNIPYTPGAAEPCGSFHTVDINVSSDAGMQPPVPRTFRLGEPVGGAPATFENTTTIDLPAGQPGTTAGPANPYPSTIAVSGLTGDRIISIELTDVNHTWVSDLDMLLEAPNGDRMVIMSDAFSANNRTGTVVTTLTIRDDAADVMPGVGVPPAAGTFKPTQDGGTADTFDAPAPAAPYGQPGPDGIGDTLLSVFGNDGSTMNGDWNLWIDDDAGADPGTMDGGWKITFESDNFTCNLAPQSPRADFDGDGRTDMSVFRPSEGNWYINGSTDGFSVQNFGIASDTPVPGDYDGDGKADAAVFRPSDTPGDADFYILNSNGFVVTGAEWGSTGDQPIVGDFTGDGRDDLAVFRDSDATWYILDQTDGSNIIEPFGISGDIPLAIDNDGDGKANMAVFRGSENTWYIAKPTGIPATNFDAFPFGINGTDHLVPGDYDGDGKEDIAVFRPTTGVWWILDSGTLTTSNVPFGTSGDIPVPGDYDGDGTDDVAIYRAGTWWINGSTSGVTTSAFGLASDTPVPNRYVAGDTAP